MTLGVSSCIRLLVSLYVNQKLRVQFNSCNSDWFSVTNGIKQGGILSPTPFCAYVDGLLTELEEQGVGCTVGNHFVGALGYAHDLLLLAPTL